MTPAKLLTLLSVLALGGCCCPISGRYCQQPLPAASAPPCNCGPTANCARCRLGGCGGHGHPPLLAWLHGGHGGLGDDDDGVPSQQHDDYLSPLPKFHPVPTRPVFEPLPTYKPAVLLDPSGDQSRDQWSRFGPSVVASGPVK